VIEIIQYKKKIRKFKIKIKSMLIKSLSKKKMKMKIRISALKHPLFLKRKRAIN